MQLAPVRLRNLVTTPTVRGLAAIPHFPVLPTLLVHPVKKEYEQTVCPTSPTGTVHVSVEVLLSSDLLLRRDS